MPNQEEKLLGIDSRLIKKWENILGGEILELNPQGGGFISKAFVGNLKDRGKFFVKMGQPGEVFRREAYSLDLLRDYFLTPDVLGIVEDSLLLSFMERGKGSSSGYSELGRRLGVLHKKSLVESQKPGFPFDNTIGATPQLNENKDLNWPNFYWEMRLKPQLKWCNKKDFSFSERECEKLKEVTLTLLGQIKEDCTSLLHGDLWGGNHAFTQDSIPWIFDPASYFGHREADLGMMKLFNGFPEETFLAYEKEFPLEKGFEKRQPLYELYHVLNHINLFGSSYYSQGKAIVSRLTSS